MFGSKKKHKNGNINLILDKYSFFKTKKQREDFLRLLDLNNKDLLGAFFYGSVVTGDVRKDSDLDIFILDRNESFSFSTKRLGDRWISLCKASKNEILNDLFEYDYGHLLTSRFVNPILCFEGEDILDKLAPVIRGGLIVEAIKKHYFTRPVTKDIYTKYDVIIMYFRFLVEFSLYYLYPLNLLLNNNEQTRQFIMDFNNALAYLNSNNMIMLRSNKTVSIDWSLVIKSENSYDWILKTYKGQLLFWCLYRNSREIDSIKPTLEKKRQKLLRCKTLYETLFSEKPRIRLIWELINEM